MANAWNDCEHTERVECGRSADAPKKQPRPSGVDYGDIMIASAVGFGIVEELCRCLKKTRTELKIISSAY